MISALLIATVIWAAIGIYLYLKYISVVGEPKRVINFVELIGAALMGPFLIPVTILALRAYKVNNFQRRTP
jgi:NADH:ubiquinone oxidoreductase subunit 6 (subunit J)